MFEQILSKLSQSKFRSSFTLTEKDIKYIDTKGINIIKKHAYEIILKRLASKYIKNDGKQTPMRGHPVFIAQHATATCCRSCLYKWHNIDMNRDLTAEEVVYIVNLIMSWISLKITKS